MAKALLEKEKVADVKPTMTSGEQSARKQAVELAVAQIEKQFGKGSIMKLGEGHR
jgi:hypothetical protein